MSKNKKTIDELLEETLVQKDEQPYQIPENWMWVKFDTVIKTSSNRGSAIKQKDYEEKGRIPVIDQGMQLISGFTNNQENEYTGELPVIVFGDHTRCIKWIDFNFAQGADGTKLLKPLGHFYPKYFYYLLKIVNLPNKGYSRHFKYLRESLLPLPPANEQKRITEKVEPLLDKIEEANQLIQEAKETFELRQAAILDKAFHGELTKKWREENQNLIVELVDVLFENIKEERSKGKKDVVEFKDIKEIPYELPNGWKWVKLGDLLLERGMFDGPFGSNLKTADYTESGVRVIRLENIGRLSFDDTKRTYISEEKYASLEKHTVIEGDIIFASFISENVRTCILSNIDTKAINKADCFCIRPDTEIINKVFLLYFLSSNVCYNFLHRQIHGATRPRVNTTQLKALPIPVPPLEEQFEIVTDIQKLYKVEKKALNDLNLEDSLEELKKSILSKAFRGELGTNDPSEESAIELLKEVLQEQVK